MEFMRTTYAVSWQESDGARHSGGLELGAGALRLEGRNGDAVATRALDYADLESVHVARAVEDRLQGRPTLLLELVDGSRVRIAGVAQSGIVAELAERLGRVTGTRAPVRAAIVLPLRAGARSKAEALLAGGPPFDPADFGLAHHEVYLTDNEIVFVFEGEPGVFVEQLAADETVAKAAEAWQPLVEGPIRFGDQAYAWPR